MAGVATVDPDSGLGSRAPGLPAIDLPEAPPAAAREPLRVRVGPKPLHQGGRPSSPGYQVAANDDGWATGLPDFKTAPKAKADDGWAASLPDHSAEIEAHARHAYDMGAMEALGQGFGSGISFGAGPAAEGVAAASGTPQPTTIAGRASGEAAMRPLSGAWNLIKENVIDPLTGVNPGGLSGVVTGDSSGPATKAYRKGRDTAEKRLEQAREQHPFAAFAGEGLGGLAAPIPGGAGLTQAATLPGRLARGAVAGAAGGAAYGAGSAVSKGAEPTSLEGLKEIGESTAINAGAGAGIGAALHGALGPRAARVPNAPVTPGERAAETARQLGAPLPRGVASDSRAVQSLTSRMRQVPFGGERIGERVQETERAAGRRIEEIAAGASRTAPDRALAGSTLRPALQDLIEKNNGEIDKAYAALRTVTDTNQFGSVKNTKAALEAILKARRGARLAKPETGLADVMNLVKSGITFNQLQRARNHMAQMIEWAKANPNPGFDTADLRRIYAAMTADMEATVRRYAHVAPQQAADALRLAHQTAQTFIEQNGTLQRVLNVRADERMVGSLITAAQEKTGNLRLLAELKAGLPPDDFQRISGTMLNELGHNAATGEFSLNQFMTQWDKVSDNAKRLLFSPQHLRNIEDIAGMGAHIKGALKESSSSHSANLLVLLDLAKDAALLGGDIATGGGPGLGSAVGAGSSVGLWMLTRWLASPAKASSMANWSRARQALYNYGWTPARLATFNVMTRNLANNLGVPVELIARQEQNKQQPAHR